MFRSIKVLGFVALAGAALAVGCGGTDGSEDDQALEVPTATETENLSLGDVCGIICGGVGGAACADVSGVAGAVACGAAGAAACEKACAAHVQPIPSERASEACLEKMGIGSPSCKDRNDGYRHCTGHWGNTSEVGHMALSWNQRHDKGEPMNVSWKFSNHFRPLTPARC